MSLHSAQCQSMQAQQCQYGINPVQQQFSCLLNMVDYVSFDLFDTLIHRTDIFSPKDLFYRVQENAENRLGLCIDNFTVVRVRADEIARSRAWGLGVEEITLDEIYRELGRLLQLEANIVRKLKNIELGCEQTALTAMESGKRLYNMALMAGKTVIITSDTYFDEEFLHKIMGNTGFGEIFKLYASSKYRKTKVEGSLYDTVLEDLQCQPRRLLHVGDNQLSDVTMALNKGIRSYFMPTPKHHLKWRCGMGDIPSGDLMLSKMLCEVSKRSSQVIKNYDAFSVLKETATNNLSLLYYAFSAWLLEQLQNGGYQRVYFASRDGLIMKRFFDLVAANSGFEVDSRYLYVSRAALYPSLIFTEPETARRQYCQNWDHLTIENALQRLSLTFEDAKEDLVEHGLANRKLPLDRSTISKFYAFLTKVWPLIEKKHEAKYLLLRDYLHQEGIFKEEKTAFVDIGWHGSLQNCLVKLFKHLDITNDLKGFYVGLFEKPIDAAQDFKAKGFLVHYGEPVAINELVRSGPSLLELFYSAGHGSVLGYRRNGTQILPVLEENPSEQEQFHRIIEPVQNHAYDSVADRLNSFSNTLTASPQPEATARAALRFINSPTAIEAEIFGKLKIATDFGAAMKSITGAAEWNLKKIAGVTLPDGKLPMWRPGFNVLRRHQQAN